MSKEESDIHNSKQISKMLNGYTQEKSHIPSWSAKQYLAPLMRPQKFPYIPISLEGTLKFPAPLQLRPFSSPDRDRRVDSTALCTFSSTVMDRGPWQTAVHGVARIGRDLATKPPPVAHGFYCLKLCHSPLMLCSLFFSFFFLFFMLISFLYH